MYFDFDSILKNHFEKTIAGVATHSKLLHARKSPKMSLQAASASGRQAEAGWRDKLW